MEGTRGERGGSSSLTLPINSLLLHMPCLAVTVLRWAADDAVSFPGSFLPERVALVSFAAEEEESNTAEQLLTLI